MFAMGLLLLLLLLQSSGSECACARVTRPSAGCGQSHDQASLKAWGIAARERPARDRLPEAGLMSWRTKPQWPVSTPPSVTGGGR